MLIIHSRDSFISRYIARSMVPGSIERVVRIRKVVGCFSLMSLDCRSYD